MERRRTEQPGTQRTVTATQAIQTPTLVLKPYIARFWLSYWKLCCFPGPLARGGAKRMCEREGGGLFSRTRQSLICFPLGWEGGDRSNFFSAAPWEKKKKTTGQILGLDFEINGPPRESANGWSADKRLEGSNLAQTKQSVTHKALQICRGSPASPPCSSENALCSGQHCHADRHTHACPKKTPANV